MANETLEFALLAWREDGSWNASRLPDDAAQDIGIALDALRVQQVDGGAIAMLAIDDSFFIVIRQVGEDMKMMMSDALAALEYEIAAEVLELLDIDSPEEDDADEPAGDLNLLSDLGLDAMDLQMICDDSEKYPDEQLESIARQIGFGDKFLEIVENL
ncbi:MAG: tRNA adenosine deaminase-associated protein [Actinomycetales bacterium]|jgi:putative tRNA adenosine deaminase-associated protein|nr:tRNA adenosine deaminase-associated protein [Actinomycetales bacterium]